MYVPGNMLNSLEGLRGLPNLKSLVAFRQHEVLAVHRACDMPGCRPSYESLCGQHHTEEGSFLCPQHSLAHTVSEIVDMDWNSMQKLWLDGLFLTGTIPDTLTERMPDLVSLGVYPLAVSLFASLSLYVSLSLSLRFPLSASLYLPLCLFACPSALQPHTHTIIHPHALTITEIKRNQEQDLFSYSFSDSLSVYFPLSASLSLPLLLILDSLSASLSLPLLLIPDSLSASLSLPLSLFLSVSLWGLGLSI